MSDLWREKSGIPRLGLTGMLALCGSIALVIAAPTSRAHAQEASPPAAEEQEQGREQARPQGDALVEDPVLATAMEHFAIGRDRLRAEDFNAALAEFQRSYDLLEGHPRRYVVLFNLGRCYEEMFLYSEAIESYRAFLEQGGSEAGNAEEVRATLRILEGLLGTLRIETNVESAEVWMGGHHIGEAPGDFRTPSGTHAFELRREGYQSGRVEVQIAARTLQSIEVTLAELSDYEGLDPVFFYSGLGLTAAVLASWLLTGGVALGQYEDLQGRVQARDRDIAEEDFRAVSRTSLVADVLLGATGAFGVTTLVLYLLTDWEEDEPGASDAEARWQLRPSFTFQSAGLALSGGF